MNTLLLYVFVVVFGRTRLRTGIRGALATCGPVLSLLVGSVSVALNLVLFTYSPEPWSPLLSPFEALFVIVFVEIWEDPSKPLGLLRVRVMVPALLGPSSAPGPGQAARWVGRLNSPRWSMLWRGLVMSVGAGPLAAASGRFDASGWVRVIVVVGLCSVLSARLRNL